MNSEMMAVDLSGPSHLRRLGELLVSQGKVTEDQVRVALTEQRHSGEKLGKILIHLGFVTDGDIRDVLGDKLGYESVDLTKVVVDSEAVRLIPESIARRYHLLALTFDKERKELIVAMADPSNVIALDQTQILLGDKITIRPLIAGASDVEIGIEQFYGHALSIDGVLREIDTGEINYRSLENTTNKYGQPLVRLVNALLFDAVTRNASDIHFEPETEFLRIRYRIDGVLREIRSLHRDYWSAIAIRIKVMAGLNIAETRAPQDGHTTLSVLGRNVDFRVSSLPTAHGENIVLRILDRQKGIVALEALGLTKSAYNTLERMMARPEGIILVTGPTGSGKTTTLYSMLNQLNTEAVNIMTLEDPVEYPLERVRQTSINRSIKFDFANGVRSLMRQDPDIILVGEIRDVDTAEMALRAAMTGHQVFSTLHTHSAVGALARLIDIGIRPEIFVGNIIGVIAQRLVRRLCLHCREPYEPDTTACQLLSLEGKPLLYRPRGCSQCDAQGYRGRFALMEVLRFDHDIDDLVARCATVREITEVARSKGFISLAQDAIRRILEGSTSLGEVSRVMDLTDRFLFGRQPI